MMPMPLTTTTELDIDFLLVASCRFNSSLCFFHLSLSFWSEMRVRAERAEAVPGPPPPLTPPPTDPLRATVAVEFNAAVVTFGWPFDGGGGMGLEAAVGVSAGRSEVGGARGEGRTMHLVGAATSTLAPI